MIELLLSILLIYGALILLSIDSAIMSKIIWFPFLVPIFKMLELDYKNKGIMRGGGGVLANNKKNRVSWFSNTLIIIFVILGLISITGSVVAPKMIRNYYKPITENYETIADLAGIGDFIGGTTVAFLSTASVFLLLATIIMQRKEIKISQQGIDELVKQTEASIQQADDAREEVEITNKTMKRQQFDNTFFNMVNLHHSILTNLKVDTIAMSNHPFSRQITAEGRELISILYDEFMYQGHKDYRKFKFDRYFSDDEIQDIYDSVYPRYEKNRLLEELDKLRIEGYFFNDIDEYKALKIQINNGLVGLEKYPNLQKVIKENPFIISQINETEVNLRSALLNLPDVYHSPEYHEKMSDEFIIKNDFEWERTKINCYETFYRNLEYIFGHYYRNLYRIVKYINESKMIDDLEKKEFRGILRAQLSSHELMMLFYNVAYSEKGEKFKTQIQNKNFFDDHLISDGFAWNDDLNKLKK